MEQLDSFIPLAVHVLSDYMPKKRAKALIKRARADYIAYLPELPYIGGDANPHTWALVNCAYYLKVIPLLLHERVTLRQGAKIGYDIVYQYWNNLSPFRKWMARNFLVTERHFRKLATWEPPVPFPYDWQVTFVPGEGKNFDFGIDVTQCGAVRLFRDQGLSDYMPYICQQDFASIKPLNIRMTRTQTLACGSLCDFRYLRDQEGIEGWPPESLPEFSHCQGSSV